MEDLHLSALRSPWSGVPWHRTEALTLGAWQMGGHYAMAPLVAPQFFHPMTPLVPLGWKLARKNQCTLPVMSGLENSLDLGKPRAPVPMFVARHKITAMFGGASNKTSTRSSCAYWDGTEFWSLVCCLSVLCLDQYTRALPARAGAPLLHGVCCRNRSWTGFCRM